MTDSGASETVANSENFEGIECTATSATGTRYSAASAGGPSIINAGEKTLEVKDNNGTIKFMKVQMCDNLSKTKYLAFVSRICQAGHRVVFDEVADGSYIEDKKTGYRTWLRQENGVYYLDLWVKTSPVFVRQGSSK